jgi:probable phosphoglycerate mutase
MGQTANRKAQTRMAIRTLYLIRHGQYPPESSGTADEALTPVGQQQAAVTGQAIKGIPVNTLYYSTMPRAEQTAHIIMTHAFPGVIRKPSELLREAVAEVPERYAAMFENVKPQHLERAAQQGEEAFNYFFRPAPRVDRYEVLVTHGNLIRYFVMRALEASPRLWANFDSHNCGITRIRIGEDGRCTVVSYNDIGHLSPRLQTDNLRGQG